MTRPTSPALDAILGRPIPCLDHGFIRVLDYMGDDAAIVAAARVSYGDGTRKTSDDRALLRYLMRHRHTSPSEMAEIKIHVKAPVFVARQWIRHRMASINEKSARYSVLSDEFYLPRPEDLAVQSRDNKQGRGNALTPEQAQEVQNIFQYHSVDAHLHYTTLMDEYNLARELARMTLTLNHYTEWYWKIDAHNLLHFLALRMDAHAQYEIRVYANAIADIVRQWLPLTYEAFEDYRLNAATLSAGDLAIVRAALAGQSLPTDALTARELAALRAVFPELP